MTWYLFCRLCAVVTTLKPRPRRAIGIARVSVEGKRTEERLYSYDIQARAIETNCERDGVRLLYVGRERNVSGGADLESRPELSRAVKAVEAGDAELIVVAYFDRFFRSLAVQHQVIARVESAGGELLTLDHGRLTNGTAAERLNANMMGSVAQFFREQAAEKSRAGQAAAVARGAIMWSRVPIGLRKRDDSTLEPIPELAPVIREAFDRRLAGESIPAIMRWLATHGIETSQRGVQEMLAQRLYIGELHFRHLKNPSACEPIVDRDVFERVQGLRAPRGPQPKSTRLLARLKVIRCGNCNYPLGPMNLKRKGGTLTVYRCPSTSLDCPKHLTINADSADEWVWDRVKQHLADAEERASVEGRHAEVAAARDAAQERLDRAVRAYTAAGVLDEAASIETLAELRECRDAAQQEVNDLPPSPIQVTVKVDDDLPQEARREIIRATVKAVTLAPREVGRSGASRLSITFH